MKHKQKTRAWLLSLAAVVLLMSNVHVGRAEEEPFGNITKLWEIPITNLVGTGIYLDTLHKKFLRKTTATEMTIYNLLDGSIIDTLYFEQGIDNIRFVENMTKFMVTTGVYFNNSRNLFYSTKTWEMIEEETNTIGMTIYDFTDDRQLLVGCNAASVVSIFDNINKVTIDTIPMERVEQYGYSTRPPGDIRISPDKKYILTVTSYEGYQQTIPAVTIFHVYDLSTKESIMRFVAKSPSQYVLSNDWKYLYVAERKFDQQKNETEITLNEISTDGLDKRTQKFIDESFDELFISDNNKFLIYQPYPIKFRYFNLLDKKLNIEPNLFSNINIYRLQQIKDGYLFLTSINGLSCYNINNSILSNIVNYYSSSLVLFPNPTDNQITIDNIITVGKTFKMTNISGREIPILDKMQITDNSISIDMTSLISGTYYLNISDKTSSKTYIIKKI